MPDVGPEKHRSARGASLAPGATTLEPRTLVVRSFRKSPSTPAEALVIPILRYRDPIAAVEWLGHAFGLNCHLDAAQGRAIARAQFRLGTALVFLGPECVGGGCDAGSALQLNGLDHRMHIATNENVDVHCARALRFGAEILLTPRDTRFGNREYACRDPEGHVWSVGSYRGEP